MRAHDLVVHVPVVYDFTTICAQVIYLNAAKSYPVIITSQGLVDCQCAVREA